MNFANVAVNSAFSGRHSYTYSIPSHLQVAIGQAVWVPFGSKILQGIIIGFPDTPDVQDIKDIQAVITASPLLSVPHVRLALWLSERYLSPLFDAVSLMLPPGFERRVITYVRLKTDEFDLTQLTPQQAEFVRFLQGSGVAGIRHVEKLFGKKKSEELIRQLAARNIVQKVQQLERVKVKPRLLPRVRLNIAGTIEEAIDHLERKKAYKQASVIQYLYKRGIPVFLAEIKQAVSCQRAVIDSLERNGLVSIEYVESKRDPLDHLSVTPLQPVKLTVAQQKACKALGDALSGESGNAISSVFLLYGVTGSGKTEIYLRALAEVISRGKRGVCLVPEIALTPQMIDRFTSRFPGRVGIMHSGLSLGEQFDEWYRMKEGEFDVVVGPRSALFVPQPDLGLIIIDEEHEWTYKQADKSPRYHAREVALKLAEFIGGVTVVLGSATPDVETYYKGQIGEYKVIELDERITPGGIAALPDVAIIDLRQELRSGNRSLLSRPLVAALTNVLDRGEQAILFLNRRGTANVVRCEGCGFVFRCRRCSAALAYHSQSRKLLCHHCHYAAPIPVICPECRSTRFQFLGIGTQKVEEEVRDLFPLARILRWDSDTTVRTRTHAEFMAQSRGHKVDIIVGTQMIAKGLDFPEVTLAAVISADTSLNLPDFRAAERTFQLLCQLAGRAGRGFSPGQVIIQTFCPDNYAIEAAAKHDYKGFYRSELPYRQQFGYPPFGRLARLVYAHTNALTCQREVERMSRFLKAEQQKKGVSDLRFIGPTPAYIYRLRGRYQWQLLLCGTAPEQFLYDIPFPRGWILDIDPIGVI